MELTAILLIVAVIIIVLLIAALYKRNVPPPVSDESQEQSPPSRTQSQKRDCPSCHKPISTAAHKCPECKSFVSTCPTCDTDSIFATVSKDGLKHLKVQSGFSTLGWPLSRIATCSSCNTPFLLCSYCGTPAPTASNNCPNCDAMLAVGVVPIVRELGEVIGGIIQRKVKTPGKKLTRK